jgi:hypothetical protein
LAGTNVAAPLTKLSPSFGIDPTEVTAAHLAHAPPAAVVGESVTRDALAQDVIEDIVLISQ